MLRHIVVFKLHDQSDTKPALKRLSDLCRSSQLLADWQVEESLDTRKGSVIVQNTLLKDGVTLDEWRNAPGHKPVSEFMGKIADWLIADYLE